MSSISPSPAERRLRFLCKAAGVACGACLLLFVAFLGLTAVSKNKPGAWLYVADRLSYYGTLVAGGVCIAAAVFARVRFRDRAEETSETESR